ncbi:MAG: type II toxin-antitoxin system RelE/ParE family toxin [Opitutaceae bacterium]
MIAFVEQPEFTKARPDILDETELLELQLWLAEHPESGDIIRNSGGCRKARWSASGRGKRGGARVIHFYHATESLIVLLRIYAKNAKSDLTPKEIQALKQAVKS